MNDFSQINLPQGAEILEQHTFPLFDLIGCFVRFTVPAQKMTVDCVIVNTQDAVDKTEEDILNLVVDSGYVDAKSDVTFRRNPASPYFYTYFNFGTEGNVSTSA